MSKSNYPHMFTPIRIGNFEARNRICHVPTDISSANADGSVNQRVITYHEEVAKGGCGFIIVGASTPDQKTGRPTVTCLAVDEDPLIPGLAELAEAMHRHGARCAVQIQHPGRQSAWPRKDLISATDMLVDLPGSAGHEVVYAGAEAHGKSIRAMTAEEIYELIEKFAEGAWRVQQAGFDAVELHGAHGYLIAQFMSPYVNKRNDRFGGSFMATHALPAGDHRPDPAQVRQGLPHRHSLFRRGVDRGRPQARRERQGGKALRGARRGVPRHQRGHLRGPRPRRWTRCTTRRAGTPTRRKRSRSTSSIPVITSHTLRDPDYCEKILAEGKADMVGLSRQMIADPYWANKARAGKKEEIRKCISCLVGCWQESLMIKRHMRCAINPAIGDERFINFGPAEKSSPWRSWAAARRAWRPRASPPCAATRSRCSRRPTSWAARSCTAARCTGKNKMRWYADWLRQQVAKLGVEVKYASVPTAAGAGEVRRRLRGHRQQRWSGPTSRGSTPIASDLRGRAALQGQELRVLAEGRQGRAGRGRRNRPDLGRPLRRRRRGREAGHGGQEGLHRDEHTASSPPGWSRATRT